LEVPRGARASLRVRKVKRRKVLPQRHLEESRRPKLERARKIRYVSIVTSRAIGNGTVRNTLQRCRRRRVLLRVLQVFMLLKLIYLLLISPHRY